MGKMHRYLRKGQMFKFLNVWQQYSLLLRSNRRNHEVYLLFQKQLLEEEGIHLEVNEIKNRITSLRRRYSQETAKIWASGGSPSRWEFYNDVHIAIGQHINNPGNEVCEQSIKGKSSARMQASQSIPQVLSCPSPSTWTIRSPSPSTSTIRSPSPSASITQSISPCTYSAPAWRTKKTDVQKLLDIMEKSNEIMKGLKESVDQVSNCMKETVSVIKEMRDKML